MAYPALPRAISLRLCQFDEKKQYHTSLLGPAIKTLHPPPRSTKSRVRTRLFGLGYRVRAEKGRGPNAREWIAGPGQGVNATFPTEASQGHPALEQEEDKSAQVENWLIDISTNGGPQPADSVSLDEMKAVLEKLTPSKSQTKRTAEESKSIKDLLADDADDEDEGDAPIPTERLGGPRYAVLNPPLAMTSDGPAEAPAQEGLDFDNDDMYPEEYLLNLRNPILELGHSDSLIDLENPTPIHTSPTASSPISFGMGALVPEPTSSAMQLGVARETTPPYQAPEPAACPTSNAEELDPIRVADEDGSRPSNNILKQTMRLQAGRPAPRAGGKNTVREKRRIVEKTELQKTGPRNSGDDVENKPESKSPVKTALERQSGPEIPAADNTAKEAERKDSVKGSVQKKTNARVAAGIHIVERPDYSSQFAQKMDDAIRQLVAKGPYLPGKITLRADFGRVLLRGIDESALNFRAEGSRSNGWPLEILSQRLRECKGTSFTKILTTDGVDVEYLVGIRDARTGQLLWNPEPTNRTIYSFACTAGQGNKNKEQFFLDIDGTEGAFIYALRGKNEDKAPISVHGLLRNWDFRVVMSHTNVAELENKFGPFARSLVANLQVTLSSETDDPRLRWGIHDDFHVAVNHMRTLTKWRFMSRDGESHLDITEVLENDVQGCKSSPDMNGRNGWFMQMAQLYKGANRGRLERLGFPDRWYEASVTSAVAEDMLCQNESLCFAARADWDFESLKDAGALNAILKPALRMLQEMDSVGAGNDNRQAGTVKLPRPNNTFVPAPGVQVEDPNAVFW